MTVQQILDEVIEREQGFVDHPNDRGGPTCWGITQKTLTEWRHPVPVRREDVERLERDEAFAILRCRYVEAPGFLAIGNDRLRAFVVDFAVHSGPSRATMGLQEALGLKADGILGTATRRALERSCGARHSSATDVFRELYAYRLRFLAWLAIEDPTQRDFIDGWLNRCARFV